MDSGVAVPFSFTLPGEDPSILNRCLLLPCWKGLLALSEMVLVKAFSGHCETSRWFVVSSSGQWCRGVTLCEQLVAAQSRLYLGNLQLSSPHPHILPTDGATLNWRAQTVKQILLISLLSPRLLRGAQLFIGWSCHRLLLGVRGWDCVDTIWIVDDLLPKMLMVTPLWPLDNNDPTSLQGTMTVIDPEPELGGAGRRRAESRNHFPVPALTPASWFMWPGYCFLWRLIESLWREDTDTETREEGQSQEIIPSTRLSLALRLLLRCHLCSCQADGSSAVAHFVCVFV